MFNAGRFNLLRFNVQTSDERDILQVIATMRGTIGSLLKFGENVHEAIFASALIDETAIGASATLIRRTLTGEVVARVPLYKHYFADTRGTCEIQTRIAPSLTLYPPIDASARVRNRVDVSLLMHIAPFLRAGVSEYTYLSKDHRPKRIELNAVLSSQVSTIRFAVSYADFDLDIPPGATLVIDSAGYVVLLDGEDVIYAHSGEWLRLSRRIHDVVFESRGSEPMIDKQILYTERWL